MGERDEAVAVVKVAVVAAFMRENQVQGWSFDRVGVEVLLEQAAAPAAVDALIAAGWTPPKKVPADLTTLALGDDLDWYAQELARAAREWASVKGEPHSGQIDCWVCLAGDGDPRCQRCGCSVGMPGCQCPDEFPGGPLIGPCLAVVAPVAGSTVDSQPGGDAPSTEREHHG